MFDTVAIAPLFHNFNGDWSTSKNMKINNSVAMIRPKLLEIISSYFRYIIHSKMKSKKYIVNVSLIVFTSILWWKCHFFRGTMTYSTHLPACWVHYNTSIDENCLLSFFVLSYSVIFFPRSHTRDYCCFLWQLQALSSDIKFCYFAGTK